MPNPWSTSSPPAPTGLYPHTGHPNLHPHFVAPSYSQHRVMGNGYLQPIARSPYLLQHHGMNYGGVVSSPFCLSCYMPPMGFGVTAVLLLSGMYENFRRNLLGSLSYAPHFNNASVFVHQPYSYAAPPFPPAPLIPPPPQFDQEKNNIKIAQKNSLKDIEEQNAIRDEFKAHFDENPKDTFKIFELLINKLNLDNNILDGDIKNSIFFHLKIVAECAASIIEKGNFDENSKEFQAAKNVLTVYGGGPKIESIQNLNEVQGMIDYLNALDSELMPDQTVLEDNLRDPRKVKEDQEKLALLMTQKMKLIDKKNNCDIVKIESMIEALNIGIDIIDKRLHG